MSSLTSLHGLFKTIIRVSIKKLPEPQKGSHTNNYPVCLAFYKIPASNIQAAVKVSLSAPQRMNGL
jgi:hypothetical protein